MSASFSLLFLLLSLAAIVPAQSKQRVRFARGFATTTVNGTVRGYVYRDYVVGARVGQVFSVLLKSRNTSPVLTIFTPHGDNLEGATQTDAFSGELPSTGDYVIRVGMMRAEARRKNSSAAYTLRISIR
jgi:hypothetical protein